MKTALVTGATGYVAAWIVKGLLENGVTVHAAVRDPSKAEKLKSFKAMVESCPGKLRFFKSNLLEEGSYAGAMHGCDVVFHTASPFKIRVEDPQRDLVDPALLGTRNVLGQAKQTESVRRVIVTSSCAAVYSDNADLSDAKGAKFTEDDWNTASSLTHQPYSYSKTLAEREAWEIQATQERWDLVTINPSLVLGPGIESTGTSESFRLMRQFGNGKMKQGVPQYGIGVVDVRDAADAHLAAAVAPDAKGRYIVSGHDSDFAEIGRILRAGYGDAYPFPKRTMPKALVWLVAPFFDKSMTRRIIARNVGLPFRADHGKSVRELGLSYRALDQSVVEMFQQMIDSGRFKK
jgi:nucleoside-diphosphate-sugar epimerase